MIKKIRRDGFTMVAIIIIIGSVLITSGIGYYFYEVHSTNLLQKNTNIIPAPNAPFGVVGDQIESCPQEYPALQQYFQCRPYIGYAISLILAGLVLLIATLILKLMK